MAAITFDRVGTELTQVRAENPSPLSPNESGGRVRIKKFSYTAPATVASGSQIELAEFGPQVTIIGGALTSRTFTGAAAIDIGWTPTKSPVDDNDDVFGTAETAPVVFDPYMATTTEKTTVFATVRAANMALNNTFSGYILYVENS